MHAYIHTCTYIHTYIHTYMHACMHTHTHTHARTHTYTHTHIHTYIHTYTQDQHSLLNFQHRRTNQQHDRSVSLCRLCSFTKINKFVTRKIHIFAFLQIKMFYSRFTLKTHTGACSLLYRLRQVRMFSVT